MNLNLNFNLNLNLIKNKILFKLTASKGFWAEIFGFGDFYYELGIQIVEICWSLREATGGLIDIDILKTKLLQKRNEHENSKKITE